MQNEKIQRINELSKLSKQRELTQEELAEQKKLRDEYIALFKANLKQQLDGIKPKKD